MAQLSDRQTFPSLTARIQLLPWHWRLVPRFYMDDIERWRYTIVEWLFLELHFSANKPMFFEKEVTDE